MSTSLPLARNVSLAERTTLAVGGPASWWLEAADPAAVTAALGWATRQGLGVELLGGGSNVLVADRGLAQLVMRIRIGGLEIPAAGRADGAEVLVRAGAGVCWDDLVRRSVAAGLSGIECLAGIPGDVGAAPIQNIGAYGQEVAQTIERVRLIDRQSGEPVELPGTACGFAYRSSIFKRSAEGRYAIVGVSFRLRRLAGPPPVPPYPELQQAVAELPEPLTPAVLSRVVLALRRRKSMVLDPADENHLSAGSFFVNPTLSAAEAAALTERAAAIAGGRAPPQHRGADGSVKVPAAWLIEQAGFPKGTADGPVGLSTRHALAIVNRGGATAGDIVRFATRIRRRVAERFGVRLEPEVRLLGFEPHEIAELCD